MRYLVPLDGSRLAEQALPYAKERARTTSGDLVLVRVINIARDIATASMGGGMESISASSVEAIQGAVDQEIKEAGIYLDQQAQTLRQQGFQVMTEVRSGVPAQQILAVAKDKGVDVVIITTHGRSGLGRMVFGSVADEVIRSGQLPVLVINNK